MNCCAANKSLHPLILACQEVNLEKIEEILSCKKIDTLKKNNLEEDALEVACRKLQSLPDEYRKCWKDLIVKIANRKLEQQKKRKPENENPEFEANKKKTPTNSPQSPIQIYKEQKPELEFLKS